MIVSRDDLMQIANDISRERDRLRVVVAQEVGDGKAERLLGLCEGYIERVISLRDRIS